MQEGLDIDVYCYTITYRIFLWQWMKNRNINVPKKLLEAGSARKIWNYL